MAVKTPIYMDYQATTPVDPQVLKAMAPYFSEHFGNPASRSHSFGWRAEAAVEAARETIAVALGAAPEEIYFTSGATESNNLAILGVARRHQGKGRHLITCATEHKAVLDPCARLEKEGFKITYLPVDRSGRIDLEQLRDSIQKDTLLISLMAANNEVGILHPLGEIAQIARESGVLFHSDAAQAAGKISLNLKELGIDLLSLSAHKFYGPKGVGAFYLRRKTPPITLEPLTFGGGQEKGIRSGTLNVPGIVGMGAALKIAERVRDEESARLAQLHKKLWTKISENLQGVSLNGPEEDRLPGNLNITFHGVPGDRLMMEMKEVALATGSACTSADPKPSHVLKAMGLSDRDSRASIRFSLGRLTTEAEVDYVAGRVTEVVTRIREDNPREEYLDFAGQMGKG